jgi:hypothetical protein
MYYGRKLSRVCGYTGELELTFYEKEILYFFCGYKNDFISMNASDSDFS